MQNPSRSVPIVPLHTRRLPRAAKDRVLQSWANARRAPAVKKIQSVGKPLQRLSVDEPAQLYSAAALSNASPHSDRRTVTFVDAPEELASKTTLLAALMRAAQHCVVYTGAGISTACGIPDYRGPDGVWTLASSNRAGDISAVSACDARPSLTHMALAELHRRGVVRHVVTQNCDALHLRSGLPREALSEIHGNMFVETCSTCGSEIVRTFDVTERSRVRRHDTGRRCDSRVCTLCQTADGSAPVDVDGEQSAAIIGGPEESASGDLCGVCNGAISHCGGMLEDTIVHYGEKGGARGERVLGWEAALSNAASADLIVCMGSSLSVLRHYPLWGARRSGKGCGSGRALREALLAHSVGADGRNAQGRWRREGPVLAIVSLQPTAKDAAADVKLNATCDAVMDAVLHHLGMDCKPYGGRDADPFFARAVGAVSEPNAHGTDGPASLPGWMATQVNRRRR